MEKIYYEPSKIFKNASAADSKDEHYVYRYEPKVYFEENISKKRLMFSSLTNWDDRLEARYLQLGKNFLKKTAVALCFTTNAQTNEAAAWGMHKKSSDKPYVQIRYNLDYIVKGLRAWAKKFNNLDPEIFIENVKYKEFKEHREKSKNLNQKKFDTRLFADLLLLKRLDFQFEGEVRILIIANQELLKQPEQNLLEVYLGESLKKACNRIRFEPFSAERVKSNEKLPKPKDDYDIVKMKDFGYPRSSRAEQTLKSSVVVCMNTAPSTTLGNTKIRSKIMGFFSNLFGKNDGSLEVGPKSKYKTISDAIAAAQEGSIIKVKPGTYHEHFTIDKKVTIEGIVDDNGNTPIVWEDTSKENFVISIEAKCTISNIEVRGAEKEFASDYTFGTRPKEANICDWWPKCIYAKSSCLLKNLKVCNSASHGITIHENCENPIIESCKCYANARMGILVRNKSESKIILSEIHSNHISGLSINGSTKNTIESCDIHSNKESGIICVENSEVSISKCKIHDNKYYSVGVEKQCQIALENSEIYKNGRPIYINEGSFGTIQNCKIEYCAGVGEINIGVSEVHIENCTITTSFGKKGIFICSKKQCSVKHCKIDCDIDKMLSDMYKTSILEDISYGFLGLEKCNSLEEYLQIVAKLKAEKEAEKQIQEEEAKKRRQEEEERKRKEKEEADRKEQERLKKFHYETFTDPRDGNTYGTVKIGNQIWMADSLRYKTPNCECHDSGNLYSWAEVMGLPEKFNSQQVSESTKEKIMEGNFQGIAPEGWHIPNRVELQQLVDYCEEHSNNTIDVSLLSTQETLKTKKGLKKGTDEFGFNFKIIKIWIPIACSSEKSQSGTHQLYVEKMETENGAYAGLFTGDKVERYQIRCVKNLSEEEQQNLYKRMVKFEIKEKEEEEEGARQKHEREMERIAENESRARLRLLKLCKYCGKEDDGLSCHRSPTGYHVLR